MNAQAKAKKLVRWWVEIAVYAVLTALILWLTGCRPKPTPTPAPIVSVERTKWTPAVAVAAAEAAMTTETTPAPAPPAPAPDDTGALLGQEYPFLAPPASQPPPTSPSAEDAATGTAEPGATASDNQRSGCAGGNCSYSGGIFRGRIFGRRR